MDTESSELMRAYVTIRADLAELERDMAKARQIVDGKLSKPAKVNVNSDSVTQAGRAADIAAAKIKGVAGVDMQPLARDSDFVTQAFLAMKKEASEAAKSLRGVSDADLRKAEAGVDRLTGKIERLGAASKRANANSLITPRGGVDGIGPSGGGGRGGFLSHAAGSFAGGLGARAFGGAGGGMIRGAAGAAMRSPALLGLAGAAGVGAVGVATGAAVAAPAVAGYGKVVKDGLGGIEDERNYTKAFDILLKDTEKAKKLFSEMAAINLEAPIDMPSLLDATQRLAQAGLTASEIPDRMRTIMDAAASSTDGVLVGTQKITALVSRVKGSGILEGEDLKVLSNMGLPIAEIVEQKFGMNIRELTTATNKGKIEIQAVLDAMFEGLDARFSGSIAKEIDSIGGQITLLKNKYEAFAGEVARPLFDPLLDALKSFNEYLSSSDFAAFTEGLKTLSKEAAATWEVLAKIYGSGESMGIGAAVGGAVGGTANLLGETVRGDALLADAGSKTALGQAAAGVPILSMLANRAAGLAVGPNTDQAGVGPTMRGGVDISLSQDQRFGATAEQQKRAGRMKLLEGGIRIGEQYIGSVPQGEREAYESNIAASRAELERLREESKAELESFRRREEGDQKKRGITSAGSAIGGAAAGVGRGLMDGIGRGLGAAAGAFGEATGLETEEQRKAREDQRQKARGSFLGIAIPSMDDMSDLVQRGKRNIEESENRESIQRRKEREKREEILSQKSIKERAEQTVKQFQSTEKVGDPRLQSMLENSKFAVSMKRNEDGQMAPSVALKELFQQSRASSQTAGFGGLNTLMQSSIDSAQERKFQADQKKLLEEVVRKLQEQINISLAEDDAEGVAVVAPG